MVIIKQLVNYTQRIRMLSGIMYDIFIVGMASPIITAMQAGGTAIAAEGSRRREAAEADGDGRVLALGAPTATMFLAFASASALLVLGGASKNTINEWLTLAAGVAMGGGTLTQSGIAERVAICKLESCFDEGMTKVVLSFRECPIRLPVLASTQQTEAVHKKGQAPPGFMEDEWAAWLVALVSPVLPPL